MDETTRVNSSIEIKKTQGSNSSKQTGFLSSEKANAKNYVVVKWLDENKLGTTSLKSVMKDVNDKEDVRCNKEYQVLFQNKPYRALILYIGTKSECNEKLDTFSFMVQTEPNSPQKQPKKKQRLNSEVSNVNKEEYELMKHEIDYLKKNFRIWKNKKMRLKKN